MSPFSGVFALRPSSTSSAPSCTPFSMYPRTFCRCRLEISGLICIPSFAPPSDTIPISSPFAGFLTSCVLREIAATHLPPMQCFESSATIWQPDVLAPNG
jgi:hypothetical protein